MRGTTEVDEGELPALQEDDEDEDEETSFSMPLCLSLARSVMLTKPV